MYGPDLTMRASLHIGASLLLTGWKKTIFFFQKKRRPSFFWKKKMFFFWKKNFFFLLKQKGSAKFNKVRRGSTCVQVRTEPMYHPEHHKKVRLH